MNDNTTLRQRLESFVDKPFVVGFVLGNIVGVVYTTTGSLWMAGAVSLGGAVVAATNIVLDEYEEWRATGVNIDEEFWGGSDQ